jgi:hypothetical protein
MSDEPKDALAAESAARPRVAYLALGAGVATLAGGIVSTLVNRALPSGSDKLVTLLPALERAFTAPDARQPTGILAQQVAYIGDHAALWVLGGLLTALSSILVLFPLRFLFEAAQRRNPSMGRAGIVSVIAGALLAGVGFLVYTIAFALQAHSFAGEAVQTSGGARDAVTAGVVQAGRLLYEIGRFALALGFVLVSLNAMRVGLLPRFLGILGIICGLLFVIPLEPTGIVRAFFLIAIGLLLLGRWMRGLPPAWSVMEAVPWPSRQARVEAAGGGPAAPDGPPAAPAPERRPPARASRKRRKR